MKLLRFNNMSKYLSVFFLFIAFLPGFVYSEEVSGITQTTDVPASLYPLYEEFSLGEDNRSTDPTSTWITNNGLPTEITYYNKGGYDGRVQVGYTQYINGKWKNTVSTLEYRHSSYRTFQVPANAQAVIFRSDLLTGLIWNPMKNIFIQKLCTANNVYISNDNKVNKIQIDTWGTTFNSPWKYMHPENSYLSRDPIACAW